MRQLSRKSQVDVALTIGSIIVPLAAIFGALIFAWAMIGPLADAAKLAAVISYDVATLADIAYSVPDELTVWYTPPGVCEFINSTVAGPKNNMVCLGGFMNITSFYYKVDTKETKVGNNAQNFVYKLESAIGVVLDPKYTTDSAGNAIPQPFIVSYPAFGDLKDYGANFAGSTINLEVNDNVKITKKRSGLYDTISAIGDLKDPLQMIVSNAFAACPTTNLTDMPVRVPPNYYVYVNDPATMLCLNKSTMYINATGGTIGNYTVYCFDFTNKDPKCTFFLAGMKYVDQEQDVAGTIIHSDANDIDKPAGSGGRCAQMNATVRCKSGTDPCTSADIYLSIVTKDRYGDELC
jgi:hypothetical protein